MDEIDILKVKIIQLEQELTRLHTILDKAGISYSKEIPILHETCAENVSILPEKTPPLLRLTPRHANILYSYFKGRTDVYSKRAGKPNPKTGKYGYYTQCWNFWKEGVCPKQAKVKIQCSKCKYQQYKPLRGKVLLEHLLGEKADGSDVIGIYPILPDETCNFLAFDFDNHEAGEDSTAWMEEADVLRTICKDQHIDCLVERSRSGRGAHVWLFFAEPIQASLARKFGSALLTKGAESVSMRDFKYYDRMIPGQDHLSGEGLGNLIALPLQGQAAKKGNSLFVDENWQPYKDQWKTLMAVQKISKNTIEGKIEEWSKQGLLGPLLPKETDDNPQKSTPWKKKEIGLHKEDVMGLLTLTLADGLYLPKNILKPRIQNQFRRMAAYVNPEFYKRQGMGYSTFQIPRIVYCGEDIDGYICLPRGCRDFVVQSLKEAQIPFEISDERNEGRELHVEFTGNLYPTQQEAVDTLLKYDNGILSAATAFGKTVVGAYLVGALKRNTLILVHNTEIMKNWVDDLQKFLKIDEELPTYKTKTGRVKRRKSCIGRLLAGHNSLTGLIDIVMISSLGKKDQVKELVKNYGMVLMDECHHGGSSTAENVLRRVDTRYMYGLTATPKRDDGQEKKVFMQFGPIRYKFTAKDRARQQGVEHYIYPRFTRLVCENPEGIKITDAYKLILESKIRNEQIVKDVKECVKLGRTPIVMTKQRKHAEILFEALKNCASHIFLLEGGRKSREKDEVREAMKQVPAEESIILVATGQYVGEGFNYPRLDTMMLTMPISWEGNVEQYAGRLHRDYAGKKDVIIYDYVDSHIRVLEHMYQKRLRTYKKIGYSLCSAIVDQKQVENTIYEIDEYEETLQKDVQGAQKQIIISSPGLSLRKIQAFVKACQNVQERGVGVYVLTLAPESYVEGAKERIQKCIDTLLAVGIHVETKGRMHEHFAVIDARIVWYGSVNFLSKVREEDNLMRLESWEIAQELLEIAFGKKN